MKKALILVFVFILSFSSTVSCEEKDNTVLNGAVSYSLPSSWKVLDKKGLIRSMQFYCLSLARMPIIHPTEQMQL